MMAWHLERLSQGVVFLALALLTVAGTHKPDLRKGTNSSQVPCPTCSKSEGLPRLIGQYEGWSIDRDCQPFVPEQIPKGIYTNLNYAYANINPETFEIQPGYLRDPAMYQRFTRLKRRDSNVKLSISIGDAIDPDQVARTLANISSSESYQRTFFNSLLSFLATYNFDGVDLNWRLPSSVQEGNADGPHTKFPDMVANLRQALKTSGGRDHLSLTLSMPDWQLRQCNITKLQDSVDFLVLTSYDYYDTDPGSRRALNAHTNLTDTENTLQLLWTEGIKPDHVVLGTSFSGKGFTAMDTTCLQPGCPYASGSEPQSCTQEIGVMSKFEIEDIIKRTGSTPVLHEDAAVKVLAFDDDQWVAFDDEETLKIKAEYAQTRCLGGMMAWVSQDSLEGHLSTALAQTIVEAKTTTADQDVPKIEARLSRNGQDTVLRHKQCMWTNCGSECPSGYNNVPNDADFEDADLGPLNKQTIIDPTGCEDSSERQWCCPTLDMPKCLWSGFESGTCTSLCPDGSVEIASSSGFCENGGYAPACCDAGDEGSNSMALYHTCTWTGTSGPGGFTDCGQWEATCPDGLSLISQSQSGSGDVQCSVVGVSEAPGHPSSHSVRSYCCDTQDRNIKWEFCGKYGLDGNTADAPGHCPGDCPDGRYRVSLDRLAPECSSGAASTCCVPMASTLNTDLQEDVLGQAEALDIFLKDTQGYCHNETVSSNTKRELLDDGTTENVSASGAPLEERDIILQHPAVLKEVEDLVSDMLDNIASHDQIDAWDSGVEEDYPFLRLDSLESYMDEFPNRSSFADYGEYLRYHGMDYGGVRDIACGMNYFNARSGRELGLEDATKVLGCQCSGEEVCALGDRRCIDEEEEEEDDDIDHGDELRRRDSEDHYDLFERAEKARGGEERPWPYSFIAADGTPFSGTFRSHTYRIAGKWNPKSVIWIRGYTLPPKDFSLGADLGIVQGESNWVTPRATEHIMELQFPREIITALATGTFRGVDLESGPLESGFIDYILNGISQQAPDMFRMQARNNPTVNIRRLMWTIGTTRNDQHFVITSSALNNLKTQIWQGNEPVGDQEMIDLIAAMTDQSTACEALCKLRNVNAIIVYYNTPAIHSNFAWVSNDFRNELLRQYIEWSPNSNAADRERVTKAYDEILRLQLEGMKNKISNFVSVNAQRIRDKLGGSNLAWAKQAVEVADNFENLAATTDIETVEFDGF